jgi:hypothetical protein
VIQTGEECPKDKDSTQLQALALDMVTLSLAFRLIPKIPKKVIEKLTLATEKLNSVRNGASGINTSKAQALAMKRDLTKSISSKLKTQIDNSSIISTGDSAEDLAAACKNLENISGSDTLTLPDKCLQ